MVFIEASGHADFPGGVRVRNPTTPGFPVFWVSQFRGFRLDG